jgi:hypothetical protein
VKSPPPALETVPDSNPVSQTADVRVQNVDAAEKLLDGLDVVELKEEYVAAAAIRTSPTWA